MLQIVVSNHEQDHCLWILMLNVMETEVIILFLIVLVRLSKSRPTGDTINHQGRSQHNQRHSIQTNAKEESLAARTIAGRFQRPVGVSDLRHTTEAYDTTTSGGQPQVHTPEYMMELYNMYTNDHYSHVSSDTIRSYVNINTNGKFCLEKKYGLGNWGKVFNVFFQNQNFY